MQSYRADAKTIAVYGFLDALYDIYVKPEACAFSKPPSDMFVAAMMVTDILMVRVGYRIYRIPEDLNLVVTLKRLTDLEIVTDLKGKPNGETIITDGLLGVAASLEALPLRVIYEDEIPFFKTV